MKDFNAGFNAGIDAAAAAADKWSKGDWRFQNGNRLRFALSDVQFAVNSTGMSIAQNIRALRLCVEAQKDNPPTREDVVREDYRDDPDGFQDKWGIPDDPSAPVPPSEGPTNQ